MHQRVVVGPSSLPDHRCLLYSGHQRVDRRAGLTLIRSGNHPPLSSSLVLSGKETSPLQVRLCCRVKESPPPLHLTCRILAADDAASGSRSFVQWQKLQNKIRCDNNIRHRIRTLPIYSVAATCVTTLLRWVNCRQSLVVAATCVTTLCAEIRCEVSITPHKIARRINKSTSIK